MRVSREAISAVYFLFRHVPWDMKMPLKMHFDASHWVGHININKEVTYTTIGIVRSNEKRKIFVGLSTR